MMKAIKMLEMLNLMMIRWEQVTKQDLTDGHSHPVNKEPTTDYMPQVIVEKKKKKKESDIHMMIIVRWAHH